MRTARPPAEIPLTRLGHAEPDLLEELLTTVRRVARTGAFTLGEHSEGFERDFAAYCEIAHAVGVASGTSALELALRALRVGPGDEVIVPANSFVATAEAVSAVGAKPLLVDVDPDTHLMTADHVAAALGPRVRCAIPVHLYGSTVDMEPLLRVTRAAGVAVVEDACQAHGARYRGRRAGTLGDLGCFSFYPTKNLGGWGDGGAVVTADSELADRIRMLRSHGERTRYRHEVVGGTARLDAIQAAVLAIKLRELDGVNDERRRLGRVLRHAFAESGIAMPRPPFVGADHVYHLFVVRSHARDALRLHLRAAGIASAVHYPKPIHLTEAYAHLGLPRGSLPVSERLAVEVCSVPLFPGMSNGEVDRVIAAVVESSTAEAGVAASR
ncbi:MAG: DegT/DnrJ/EryC1/StrS family aminotransferase [Frankiales bacterium]|nr:DegT/DnrJ/EryC1/StrS family aminotransferase [Frankiales bacterium]